MKKKLLFLLLLLGAKLHAGTPATPKVQQMLPSVKEWAFVENKGQLADPEAKLLGDILYYGKQGGVSLYLRQGRLSFVFSKTVAKPAAAQQEAITTMPGKEAKTYEMEAARMDMVLVGANPHAVLETRKPQTEVNHFYLAHTPEEGIHAGMYKEIIYKEIYPHIDMVLKSQPGGLKYEFILRPGGRVSDIQLSWGGTKTISRLKEGGMHYDNALGYLNETKPLSFLQNGRKIKSRFVKQGNTISFATSAIPEGSTLTIDPNIVWGTYYGSGRGEDCLAITADGSGNIMMTGNTNSMTALATSGAWQTSSGGVLDAYVARFSPGGTRLWCTFFGGKSDDYGTSIAVSTKDETIIGGYTTSITGLASSGAYKTSYSGNTDAFIAKFSKGGTRQWATYYGGSKYDNGYGVTFDQSGNIYMVGGTSSPAVMATSGAFLTSLPAASGNGFIVKFSNFNGSRIWGTYFRGIVIALQCVANELVLTGESSMAGLATSGAWQTSLGGSTATNAFIAKFDTSCTQQWATYYGGNLAEAALSLIIDTNKNIYLTGTAGSLSGISSSGAWQQKNNGNMDAFLAKFDKSGQRQWATYLGGKGEEYGYGIALDQAQNIYIAGYTYSDSFIASSGSYQTKLQGMADAFLAKFTQTGKREWSSYYGGADQDIGRTVYANLPDIVYVGGRTRSTSGIATSGAFQATSDSPATDIFLAKFYIPCTSNSAHALDTAVCNKGFYNLHATGTSLYRWYDKPLGGNLLDTFANLKVKISKTDTYYVAGYNGICESRRDTVVIKFNPPPLKINPSAAICLGDSFQLGAVASATSRYSWTSTPAGFSSTIPNPKLQPAKSTIYQLTVTDSISGCQAKDSLSLKVNKKPIPGFTTTNFCMGDKTQFTDTSQYAIKYLWSFGNGDTSSFVSPAYTYSNPGSYKVKQSLTSIEGCQASDSQTLTINPNPVAGFKVTNLCFGDKTQFSDTSRLAVKYLWQFGNGDTSIQASPALIYNKAGAYSVKQYISSAAGCKDSTSASITIHALPDSMFDVTSSGQNQYIFMARNRLQASYTWNFGDGNKATGDSTTYQYATNGNYKVRLLVSNTAGCKAQHDTVLTVFTGLVSNETSPGFNLSIMPNPFSESTHIQYNLPQSAKVTIEILDLMGRRISIVNEAVQEAGPHSIILKASELAHGTYILKISAGGEIITRHLIKMK